MKDCCENWHKHISEYAGGKECGCPCHAPQDTQWEKEFDARYDLNWDTVADLKGAIKSFIASLVATTKEEEAFKKKFPLVFKAVNTSVDLGENADITTVQTEHATDEDLVEFFSQLSMKSKPKIRRVKAWAVVHKSGDLVEGQVTAIMSKALRNFYNKSALFKVVRCEITYQLPPLPKKKR